MYHKFNKDIPSDNKVGIVTWLWISNDDTLEPKHTYNLMQIWHEKISIRTHTKDKCSFLTTTVDFKNISKNVRKTCTTILELAFFIKTDWEELEELWYNRDSSLKSNEIKYTYPFVRKSIIDIYNIIEIIELLIRDDVFFCACQNIFTGKVSHNFCLICFYKPSHLKNHIEKEPSSYEYIKMLPNMETSIVKSTRCIESIIWKPGKKDKSKKEKEELFKNKVWINPQKKFHKTWLSYIDFYYNLFFDKRNSAAHSYWKINFELENKFTIAAQCFAFEVVLWYLKKNKLTKKEALKTTKFNYNLYKKIPKDYSTNKTK